MKQLLRNRICGALVASLTCLLPSSLLQAQKFEGLALTPPMGWNSWNTFESHINEQLVKDTAEAMIRTGMRDAGYVYIVLDDCWSLRERDPEGNLVADPEKFPSGMKALADYLHERGFKFGIYGCAGKTTCAGYPGSMGHEYQDARTFASWGVDYLKYDWCATGTRDAIEAYTTMRDALYQAGRPIVFSLCEWGTADPWLWGKQVGHLWRVSGDIYDCWDCEQEWSRGWKSILDLYHNKKPSSGGRDGLGQYSGPDGWNDLDMMEVGNAGLSTIESRSHFALWCMVASPLMAGNDLRIMSDEIAAILTDKEALAINQDPLGVPGWRYGIVPDKYEIWIRPLEGGDWAVCVLNDSDQDLDITLEWERLERHLSGHFEIFDIWDKQSLGTNEGALSKRVKSHDTWFMRLSNRAG
ncbi:MAG: glycoside hydrolase family 27 protein [Puniceicoccaceae bacterium]